MQDLFPLGSFFSYYMPQIFYCEFNRNYFFPVHKGHITRVHDRIDKMSSQTITGQNLI